MWFSARYDAKELFFREDENEIVLTDEIELIAGLTLNKGRVTGLPKLTSQRSDFPLDGVNFGTQSLLIAVKSPQAPQDSVEHETRAEENQAHDENVTRAMEKFSKHKTEALERHGSILAEFFTEDHA